MHEFSVRAFLSFSRSLSFAFAQDPAQLKDPPTIPKGLGDRKDDWLRAHMTYRQDVDALFNATINALCMLLTFTHLTLVQLLLQMFECKVLHLCELF